MNHAIRRFPTAQSTDSTSLGVLTNYLLKALQFTHLPVHRMQMKSLNIDSERSEDMYGTATRDSDVDNYAEDTTDLFEEMNDKAGQSNGRYFPFPSKIFALLYFRGGNKD